MCTITPLNIRGGPESKFISHGPNALVGCSDSVVNVLIGVLGGQKPAFELARMAVNAAFLHLCVEGTENVFAHITHGVAVVVQTIDIAVADKHLEQRSDALTEAVEAGIANDTHESVAQALG